MSEAAARTYTLEQLQAAARQYMQTEFGTPKLLPADDQAAWYTRYGLLLDFNTQLFDGQIGSPGESDCEHGK